MAFVYYGKVKRVNDGGTSLTVAGVTREQGEFVISGELPALDRAVQLIKQGGARRVFPLRISIASHSPLMQQAAMRLAEIIDRSPLSDPQVPVVTNIAGQVRTSAEHMRPTDEVARQVVAMIKKNTSSVQKRYRNSGKRT